MCVTKHRKHNNVILTDDIANTFEKIAEEKQDTERERRRDTEREREREREREKERKGENGRVKRIERGLSYQIIYLRASSSVCSDSQTCIDFFVHGEFGYVVLQFATSIKENPLFTLVHDVKGYFLLKIGQP